VRLVLATVVALTGLTLGSVGAPSIVLAAAPDLTLVTSTTYEVRPDEGRLAITTRITATNHLKDSLTRRYFFEQGYLAVLPGASNFKLTAATGSPSVAVSSRSDGGTVLRLRFGSRLAAGKSLDLTLTFDLVDPGGAPDRAVRISPSLVLFQAWAFASASTPGSSVEVRIPADYAVTTERGPLTGPETDTDGWHVFSSGSLADPLAFIADVAADRPGGYVERHRSTGVGQRTAIVLVRAWPDDPAWQALATDVVLRALPALGDEIGAPWPLDQALTVAETLEHDTGGRASTFDSGAAVLQAGYAAPAGAIIHEAAHAWFNGRLVADRWIAEAFAAYYAELAAGRLDVPLALPDLDGVLPGPAFPLNAWPAAGAASADEDTYGLAASLGLARRIAALVGDDTLREVWRAAAAGEAAYQPPGSADAAGSGAPVELGAAPPDWRALLDLLEAKAPPATATTLEGLWRRWVVRTADRPLVDARAVARERYLATVAAAGPWRLPRSIRDALRAWQFDDAEGLMADAEGVLRQRAAIDEAAAAVGVTPPDDLRRAFEQPDGLVQAPAEAAAELASLGQLAAAEALRIGDPNPFQRLGLLGADPAARLASAKTAFEAGNQDLALAEADLAQAAWRAVPDVARGRIVSAGLLGLAVLLLVWLIVQRRRLASRSRADHAHPASGASG